MLSGLGLPADPTPLHSDMHAYLAAAGVDGVKVDVQVRAGKGGAVSSDGVRRGEAAG